MAEDLPSFEIYYEKIINEFKKVIEELLVLISSSAPAPSTIHMKKWRSQQLKNANEDLKSTLAACSFQLDKEKGKIR